MSKKAVKKEKKYPEKKMAEKEKKYPAGSPENPRKLKEELYASELKEGWSEFYFIEDKTSPDDKWETMDGLYPSRKVAEKHVRASRKWITDNHVRMQEDEWVRKNTHNRKAADLAQFKITPKTTDKEIAAFVERIKIARDELTLNPPAKMPKFTEPEYPKYRIQRRVVKVIFGDET